MPTFFIPAPRLPELTEKVAAIQKRATKLGLSAVLFRETGNDKTEEVIVRKAGIEPFKQIRKYVEVEVEGNPVILPGGWKFAATLQRLDGEVVVNAAIHDLKIPLEFRNADRADTCDHCETLRRRKDTYLLIDEAGAFKVVGTNCLVDFLHAKNAVSLAEFFTDWQEFVSDLSSGGDDDESWGGSYAPRYATAIEVLTYAQQDVSDRGYYSRAKAEETGAMTTGSAVISHGMYPSPKLPESERIKPTAESKAKAEEILAWAMERFTTKEAEELDSDYERNLRAILKASSFELRNVGLVASLVPAYHRFIEGERLRVAGQKSRHVGVIGTRMEMTLTLQKVITYESFYGVGHIYKFTDADHNVFVWFSSSTPQRPTEETQEVEGKILPVWKNWEEGQTALVKATVKNHDVYVPKNAPARAGGTKQTILSRVAAFVPKPPKAPRAPRAKKVKDAPQQ